MLVMLGASSVGREVIDDGVLTNSENGSLISREVIIDQGQGSCTGAASRAVVYRRCVGELVVWETTACEIRAALPECHF